MHSDKFLSTYRSWAGWSPHSFQQWADLPIRPVDFGGWDNRTFHLGEQMTVRLPSAAGYALQVEKEQRWLPRLAPLLPLPIPVPLAMGQPGDGYPWHWSVYRWLDGETATIERIADLRQFAIDLAHFLVALHQIDATGGPPPGPHNFYRGGPLTVYDAETRQAIAALDGTIDTDAATEVWEAALKATWHGSPVWVHGDVAAGNLLVKGPVKRRYRLRQLGRGRSRMRSGDCVDALFRRKPGGVPRGPFAR